MKPGEVSAAIAVDLSYAYARLSIDDANGDARAQENHKTSPAICITLSHRY